MKYPTYKPYEIKLDSLGRYYFITPSGEIVFSKNEAEAIIKMASLLNPKMVEETKLPNSLKEGDIEDISDLVSLLRVMS